LDAEYLPVLPLQYHYSLLDMLIYIHGLQVINMEFGIVEGLMMTVHATTGSFHCFWITLETVEL